MMRRGNNRDDLNRQLTEVDRRIAEHPLASADVRTANQLVEQMKAANADSDEINTALDDQGHLRLEELGKYTVRGILSWGLLHRRKRRIERKTPRTKE